MFCIVYIEDLQVNKYGFGIMLLASTSLYLFPNFLFIYLYVNSNMKFG